MVIAGRILDQLSRLPLSDGIGRTRHDDLPAASFWLKRETELAEGEAAEILPERRFHPGLSTVGRYLNSTDAIAAVPSDTADRDGGAGLDLRTVKPGC